MKKIGRILTSAVAISALVAVAGCSGGSGDSGTTTLSWFSWDSKADMSEIIAAFEKENPTIKLDFSHAPAGVEYNDTLMKRLLGGTAADVFMIDGENRTDLIEGQFVTDLTDKPYMAVLADGDNGYGANGRNYGMNTFSWGNGVFYNEELTDAVGMTEPPQTWEEFLDLCQKLKDSGVDAIYESLPNAVSPLLSALVGADYAQKGGDVDAKIFDGTSSFEKEWTDSFAAYQEIYTRGLAPQANVGLTTQQQLDAFTNGQVAMIMTGPWDVASIRAAAPDMKFNMMGVPGVAAGSGLFFAGSSGASYAINSKTDKLEAAETFLTFLSSKEGVELYNKAVGAITTTKNFKAVVDPAVEPLADGIRSNHVYWPVIGWKRHQLELNVVLVASLQQLAMGQITPVQASQALDQKLAELDNS